MYEQSIGFLFRSLWSRQCPALTTVIGIMNGSLISDLGYAKPLLTDAQTRDIHHDEHRCQSLILFTNQTTSRTVIVHDTCAVAVNSHFMLDRTAGHCVFVPRRSVFIDDK